MVAEQLVDEPKHGMQQLVVDQSSCILVFVDPQQLVLEHLGYRLLSGLPVFVVYGVVRDLGYWDCEA